MVYIRGVADSQIYLGAAPALFFFCLHHAMMMGSCLSVLLTVPSAAAAAAVPQPLPSCPLQSSLVGRLRELSCACISVSPLFPLPPLWRRDRSPPPIHFFLFSLWIVRAGRVRHLL